MANKKLTEAQAMWIRYVWQPHGPYSTGRLSQRFHVSVWTIRDLIAGRTYPDLLVEDHPLTPDAFWRTDDPEQQLHLLGSIEDLLI